MWAVSLLFLFFLIKYTFRVFKYSLYHLEIFKSCCSSSHQGYLIFLSVQILFVWTVIFHYHHNTVKDVVGLVAWVSLQSYSLLRSLLLVYFPFGWYLTRRLGDLCYPILKTCYIPLLLWFWIFWVFFYSVDINFVSIFQTTSLYLYILFFFMKILWCTSIMCHMHILL